LLSVALSCCGPQLQPAPAPVGDAFENGGARLAYTIDLPSGPGPYPAVVIGHGSGRVTRDQLKWFSDRWNGAGYATLRFDKRGVGESTGVYAEVPAHTSPSLIPLLASDVVAAVRHLRTQPNVDSTRVGLAGVSQAGWILPHAARELGGVAFMVLWSGPVCSVGLENYYSSLADGTTLSLEEVYARLEAFAGFDGYDPMPALQAIETPTLWIFGEEDRSIPVRTSVAKLAQLKGSGKPFEWHTYPGLGHNLGSVVWPDVFAWTRPFR
jgi:uncharacterized protein